MQLARPIGAGLIGLFCATMAPAQDGGPAVASLSYLLDDDDRLDSITVQGDPPGYMIVIQPGSGEPAIIATGLAWGSPQNPPVLDATPAGSVSVTSENANGSVKWRSVFIIAYRQGRYRIAGVEFSEWGLAFEDPETGEIGGRVCDVNLLTGKGFLTLQGQTDPKPFTTSVNAMPVANWEPELLSDLCDFPPM